MSTENFVWTDLLVAEYALSDMTLYDFKSSKTIPKKEYIVLSYVDTWFKGGRKVIDGTNPHHLIDYSHAVIHNFPIHSVQRISDGEVFTIGDKIKFPYGQEEKMGNIEKIEVVSFMEDLYITMKEPRFRRPLSCIKKVEDKEPILTKPPLGLMPMKIWREQRLDDINNAISRYLEANMIIPSEWIAERETLISWIKK